MEINKAKMVHWLDFFGVAYDFEMKGKDKIFVRRYVSSHASKSKLHELIEKLNPKKIIPIHTEKTNLFEERIGLKIVPSFYALPT